MKNISVFGMGYVGTVLYGCLIRDGHRVLGVDISEEKLKILRSGRSPVLEEGMDDLCAEAVNSGRAAAISDIEKAIHESEITFVCVGTPALSNGEQNLDAVRRVTAMIGRALRNKKTRHVVVIRSTVVPGTTEEVIRPLLEEESQKKVGSTLGLCFQPEFLREGSSIKDYYHPPFTIIGGDSEESVALVRTLFASVSGEFISTSIRIAEMVKYCCNVFHALKITFANEIGRISQALNVDPREVMDIVCRDKILNISQTYLKPGFAFGGSCLPKDLRGLIYAARKLDVQVPAIGNILASNTLHLEHAIEQVFRHGRKSIGMVGLSFKQGTDDLRESPYVVMAERFLGKGLVVKIYDPKVRLAALVGANKEYIIRVIPHIAALLCEESIEIVRESEIIVIAQNNMEFLELLYTYGNEGQVVLDLIGVVDAEKLRCRYQGICW